MVWIKEVELVDSMDDLKPSSSIRGILLPKVEVLDAKITSQSGGRKSPKRGPFPSWKTGSLGANDSVENYADPYSLSIFEMMIIQEFDSKWDGILSVINDENPI